MIMKRRSEKLCRVTGEQIFRFEFYDFVNGLLERTYIYISSLVPYKHRHILVLS